MADITSAAPKTANPVASIASTLTAPFRAIGRGLIALAEAGPRAAALRRLSQQTDAQLAACGTTRADEVRRIFGPGLYL
ncbi:DUF1127 domain-containing protein [Paracoccus zhejiangensis]|uniref:DUF1127 domain-containing protein n=1 Tax=Paracoccus zhejiangensis TaxID=1077935 RepID=UPI001E591B4E|nr:DUF1127 domain-containing protein [Paracoccus zhejiangensis]